MLGLWTMLDSVLALTLVSFDKLALRVLASVTSLR